MGEDGTVQQIEHARAMDAGGAVLGGVDAIHQQLEELDVRLIERAVRSEIAKGPDPVVPNGVVSPAPRQTRAARSCLPIPAPCRKSRRPGGAARCRRRMPPRAQWRV